MKRSQIIAKNITHIIDTKYGGNASEFDRVVGRVCADRLVHARIAHPRQTTLELIAEKTGFTVEWIETDHENPKGGDAVVDNDCGNPYIDAINALIAELKEMRSDKQEVERLAGEIDRLKQLILAQNEMGYSPAKKTAK